MESFCYLVEKIGPYHAARLGRVGEGLVKVIVVELAPGDQTYAWQPLTADPDARFISLALPGSAVRATGGEALWRLLDQQRPAVVFLNGWADRWALRALDWCLRHRVPAVVMSDSQERDEPRRGWKEGLKRRFVRRCQAAFVAGRRHAEYVQALGMPPGRVALGYDAVDNDYFSRGAADVRTRPAVWSARLGLPEGRPFFLCVSRFVPKKNLPRLLRAFALYVGRHRAAGGTDADLWHLVLLGDGEGRGDLESRIAAEGLAAQVHLPGFRQYDELPGFYGLAGALVLASTSDQWGLAVNEAMAAGLPVLVSEACGCAPELVRDGVNGYAFDPADTEGLAVRLAGMAAADPARRRAMAEAGRGLVAAWSLDRFADGMRQAARMAAQAPAARGWDPALPFDRTLFHALARLRTP